MRNAAAADGENTREHTTRILHFAEESSFERKNRYVRIQTAQKPAVVRRA